jgi:hypothetical protein
MKQKLHWINLGLLAIVLTACLNAAPSASPSSPTPHSSESSITPRLSSSKLPVATVSPSEPAEPERREATLLAVGDIMVHMPQLSAYYNATSKSYELSSWFTSVKPLLQTGDWVIGNLETPVAGRDLKLHWFS